MNDPLLLSRRFAPLFWCQFFSAFSDNFLKNALVFLILFGQSGPHAGALVTLASAVFIAPFFFLSALGGECADRFDKARGAQRLKAAEIGVAVVAAIGFLLGSVPMLFAALFGFGVIGALFGPIKYGILPDHLTPAQLPAGNALVEGATFLAILLGTIAGGLSGGGRGAQLALAALMIAFALACWISSLFIPPTGAGAPGLRIQANIARSTAQMVAFLWRDGRLWWGTLVVSWFWLVGVVVLSLLPPLVKTVLGGNDVVATAALAGFSIAVACGSGLAAWLAHGRIVLWPTVLGGALLAVFALDLGWIAWGTVPPEVLAGPEVLATARGAHVLAALCGLAAAGGLFIVPAFAAVQFWAGAERRARVIAGVNIVNAAFMVGATLVVAALQSAGVGLGALLLGLGAGNALATLAIARTLPREAAA